MKRCPKHYWFEYDETQGGCQLCEREAMKSAAALAPAPAAEPPAPPPMPTGQAAMPWGSAATPQPAASAASLPLTFPATQTEQPRPTFSATPVEQPQEPQIAPSAFEPPPRGIDPGGFPTTDIDPPPTSAEPLSPEDADILAQLSDLKRNGEFTILLLGFFAGGKTWFLNRVKHELGKSGYDVSPHPPRDKTPVGMTRTAQIYHIRRRRSGQVETSAIVDIPGERLRDLVEKNFSGIRSVLAAMDMCDALIVALPADEVLLSADVAAAADRLGGADKVLVDRCRDDPVLAPLAARASELVAEAGSVEAALARVASMSETDQDALKLLEGVNRLVIADRDLDEFTHDVCFMTGLMSKLRQAGNLSDPRFNFRQIDPAAVNLHIGSAEYVPFSRPTYVAMTKADLISHPDPLLAALIRHSRVPDISTRFNADPMDTLYEVRPSLAAKFREWLPNVKFDFATAFHEHDPTDMRINYAADHFGIGAVFRWITSARGWDRRGAGAQRAEARAARLREARDGRGHADADFGFMSERARR